MKEVKTKESKGKYSIMDLKDGVEYGFWDTEEEAKTWAKFNDVEEFEIEHNF